MIGLEASSIETLFAYLSQCCSSSSLDAVDLRKRQNMRVYAARKCAVVAKSPAKLPSVSGPMPVLLTCSVLCIAIGEFCGQCESGGIDHCATIGSVIAHDDICRLRLWLCVPAVPRGACFAQGLEGFSSCELNARPASCSQNRGLEHSFRHHDVWGSRAVDVKDLAI